MWCIFTKRLAIFATQRDALRPFIHIKQLVITLARIVLFIQQQPETRPTSK